MTHPTLEDAYQLFLDGTKALSNAERHGILVDVDYIIRMQKRLTDEINDLEEQFTQTSFYKGWHKARQGKVNIRSGSQLSDYLYRVKGYKMIKETRTGAGSTDDEALSYLGLPALDLLLALKKKEKIRDTYLDSFLREQTNGVLHPMYNLNMARSYRSSSSAPNFQNIPKRDKEAMSICRGAIIPRPGHQIIEIDFSGAEVRVSCCYHKDPNLIRDATDPAFDMHSDLAKEIFFIDKVNRRLSHHKTLRQAAKNGFVFPQFYGSYYKNCAPHLACTWGGLPRGRWSAGQGIQYGDITLSDHLISHGIKSLDSFTEHIRRVEEYFWGERYPDYERWKNVTWGKYQKRGYIDMLTGFRCGGVMSKQQVNNLPIQGASFHCLLWTFIEVDKEQQRWNTKLIGQIHDSMIFDADPTEVDGVVAAVHDIITHRLPEHWPWLIVPMEIEVEKSPVDKSWSLKEEN